MRLSVTSPISTKDGTNNKNSSLTNCLKESKQSKDAFVWVRGVKQPAPPIDKAVVRPGLVLEAEGTGVGGGLVAFDNELISVYGTTLGFATASSGGWTGPSAITYDALGDPYTLSSHPEWDGTKWLARIYDTASMLYIINESTDGINFSYVAAFPNDPTTYPNGLQSYFGKWYVQDNTGATDTVLMSSNSGASWSALSTLPFVISVGQIVTFYAIGSDLYAQNMNTGDAAKSTDQGVTWGASFSSPLIWGGIYTYTLFFQQDFQSSLWFWDPTDSMVHTCSDPSIASTPISSPFDGDPTYVLMASDGVKLYLYNATSGLYSWDGYSFTYLGTPGYSMSPTWMDVSSGILYFLELAQTTTYTGPETTIAALTTIQIGLYDFAQSSQ